LTRGKLIGMVAASAGFLAVCAVGVVSWMWSDAREFRILSRRVTHPNPQERQKALWRLGSLRTAKAAALAGQALRNDPNPEVREAGAAALQKMNAKEYYEPVRAEALRCPEHSRPTMVIYAARLGGKQALPWLRQLGDDPNSEFAPGAVIGRLELGDRSADHALLEYLTGRDPARRAFAATWMTRWMRVMSESIGRPIDLPSKPEEGVTDAQAKAMATWWRDHVTDKLLTDAIARMTRRDLDRRELARLMGARRHAMEYLEID